MDIQALALRWIHILCAIALVGGTYFWRFALVPALNGLDASQRDQVSDAVRPRWARVVMITSGLLLLSGLWNAVANIMAYQFEGGLYHGLVGIKLLLALAIMFIAAKLSGRSQGAAKFREKQTHWLTINALLATLLVCTAGVMKVSPHVPKVATSVEAGQGDSTLIAPEPASTDLAPAN